MSRTWAHARTVSQLGFWSAVVVAASSSAFSLAAVFEQWVTFAPPWDVALTLVPSLLLAPAFLVLMVSVHDAAREEK